MIIMIIGSNQVSPNHLSEELLSCIFAFIRSVYKLPVVLHVTGTCFRYLSVAPNGEQLLQQLIEHLLFNAHLWTRASKEVSLHLNTITVYVDCTAYMCVYNHSNYVLSVVPKTQADVLITGNIVTHNSCQHQCCFVCGRLKLYSMVYGAALDTIVSQLHWVNSSGTQCLHMEKCTQVHIHIIVL